MAPKVKKNYKKLPCLSQLEVGAHARIAHIKGSRKFVRRLLSLGLREGVEVDVIQRRGRSVVVSGSGTRVAVGSSIAEKLFMQPLKDANKLAE
ncbi:MAG: ferrous iron transport protein A [Gammaproteobacteria bacterium]|nr:ferrous iron transport protein A [Gammaproteobacteria bacterium]